MKKVRITEGTLKGLKTPPAGKRAYVWDAILPGFGISTTDVGSSVYIVYTRFGGKRAPSRRKLGKVGAMTLADARAAAREQLEAAHQGRDPKAEERAEALAKAGRLLFGDVLEAYISKQVSRQRRAKDTTRELRNYLLAKWAERPLEEIERADVVKLVEAIAERGAERQALNVLGLAKTFFAWCVESGRLKVSPCAGIRGAKLIGEKKPRQRVLSDKELAAVWNAAGKLTEPWRGFLRLLMLTGARKSEVSDARWSEFDLKEARLWTVPAERFKSDAVHLVPLSPAAVDLLEQLPRGEMGKFVFSTTGGLIPVDGFSKIKAKLDGLVEIELGETPEPWQIHDIRRSVRTQLAKLRIPTEVAELVIGHTLKGLHKVYDQHTYDAEKREALELWAGKLRDIVTPPPANVTALGQKRKALRA